MWCNQAPKYQTIRVWFAVWLHGQRVRSVTRGCQSGRTTPFHRQKGQKVCLVSQVKKIFEHAMKLNSFYVTHLQPLRRSLRKPRAVLTILSKIIKIVATSCQILRLNFTKFYFGWGSESDPDPAMGSTHSAPPNPLARFKG